jgi:DNA-directed RNA polymerase subunit K/omega
MPVEVVPENERVTSNIMTGYEYCEAVGLRSKQIQQGSTVFVDKEEMETATMLAIKEITQRKSPNTVVRDVGCNRIEIFNVNEMGFPTDQRS